MVKKTTTIQPKTIKVRTVVISVAVLIALIASFFMGVSVANGYNDTMMLRLIKKPKLLKNYRQNLISSRAASYFRN